MPSILIIKKCPICERRFQRPYPLEGYTAWRNGALIQDALPNETPDSREFLLTGICPECWDNEVKEEDYDD